MDRELEAIIREKLEDIMELEHPEEISPEEDLKEYGMDSLNAIELVVALELEFDIEFSEEDLLLDNLCTIEKLIHVVEKYRK